MLPCLCQGLQKLVWFNHASPGETLTFSSYGSPGDFSHQH